jgi:ADP-heptose:LPS heptosyltransferase
VQDIQNILFIRFKSMGDVVFTLPAIKLLRHNFPKAKITYLTSAENESIVAAFSDVNKRLALDRRIPAIATGSLQVLQRLRRGKFSLVIDTQCYAETAAMARFTGAPQRWGYKLGGRWRSHLYTHSLERADDRHPVDAHLKLLTDLGLKPAPVENRLRLSEQGRGEAAEFCARHQLKPEATTLFIQPFTSAPHKTWALGNYVTVAAEWRRRGVQVIFGGGPAERDLLKPALDSGFPVTAGLPLAATAWALDLATIIVGGDTGLLHLGVAMGKRVAMLMAPYGPESTIPYGHADWVICPKSGSVADLQTEAVSKGIEQAFLERTAAR